MDQNNKVSLLEELSDGEILETVAVAPLPPVSPASPGQETPVEPQSAGPPVIAPEMPTTLAPPKKYTSGDVYGNATDHFRIDVVSPEGSITIRFRSREHEKGLNFFSRIKLFIQNLETSRIRHEGEWLFGSPGELNDFITQHGYVFRKHIGKQGGD